MIGIAFMAVMYVVIGATATLTMGVILYWVSRLMADVMNAAGSQRWNRREFEPADGFCFSVVVVVAMWGCYYLGAAMWRLCSGN